MKESFFSRREIKPKRVRLFPDKELGEPVCKFEDTFSAETLLLETFFPDREKK